MSKVLNEKLTLISINISTFSGYRRATRENIAALGGSLPDSAAITEGSIKVFPCDGTKALQTIRRGLFREVQAHGVRGLGSQNVFAVLSDDLAAIEGKIAEAQAKFVQAVALLDASYEQTFETHVAANKEAEAVIRSLKIDRTQAVARCRFSTDVFKIAPVTREGQSEEDGVEGIVRGLGRQLYEEAASSMDKLLKNEAFAKNQRVGQKSLRPLKAEVQKMQKFAFLDASVEGAIKLVTDILASLPKQGYIEGQSFLTLEKLVETMADPDTLLNAASKVKNGIPPCDVLFPPAPAVAATPSQPTVTQPRLIPPRVAQAAKQVTVTQPASPVSTAFAKAKPVAQGNTTKPAYPVKGIAPALPSVHVGMLGGTTDQKARKLVF